MAVLQDFLSKELEVLQLGESGDTDIVLKDDSPLPRKTLPFGLPPVLPDLNSQLESYLEHPEKLPIHDLSRVQKFCPRTPCPESLFSAELSPLQTTLQVERNMKTGELIGFKEVYIENSWETAQTSTSMKRAPVNPTDAIRGSSSGLSFWPENFQEPTTELLKSELLKENVDFENNFLTIPPGFDRGMEFSSKVKNSPKGDESSDKNPNILSLADILAMEDTLDIDVISADTQAVKKNEDAVEKVANISSTTEPDTEEEVIEKILSVPNVPLLNISSTPTIVEKKVTQWAKPVNVSEPVNDFAQRIPNPAMKWDFELDIFQKQAILHLENRESVFVAAHTSAGKTVVAEYAIALCKEHMTKVIYTSPIKALSNQKYRDFKKKFTDVGLITGDVQINQTAFCLIMTTEILRSMLYKGSEVIRELEWVIFDEVHYINDSERGVVWEEVFIMLPEKVNLILLSATVPNTLEFADWLGKLKKRNIYVISTPKRPVPLEHYLYTGTVGKLQDDIFLLLSANGKYLPDGFQSAVNSKLGKDKDKGKATQVVNKVQKHFNPKSQKNIYIGLLGYLRKHNKLPVVCFTLSRKRCDENAKMLLSQDMTDQKEKSLIHNFISKSISKLKDTDRKLPQILWMRELLENGLAVHHSGILPILKEIVEMLFQEGLVKVLFATETFAMGVNMPARTVVFDSIRKHDGQQFRDLLPSEYIQMAGRAGRRGLDDTGTVIILCKETVPDTTSLYSMMKGQLTKLESQFRLTYAMILNHVTQSRQVEDMMRYSFGEKSKQDSSGYHQKKLNEVLDALAKMPKLECKLCNDDLKEYCEQLILYNDIKKEMMNYFASHIEGAKKLVSGRILVVSMPYHQNVLGVILNVNRSTKEKSFKVLVISDDLASRSAEDEPDLQAAVIRPRPANQRSSKNDTTADAEKMFPWTKQLFYPTNQRGHIVLDITIDRIQFLCNKTLKIEPEKIVNDWNKRQIPRFKNDVPGQSVLAAIQQLLTTEDTIDDLPLLRPENVLSIKDADVMDKFYQLKKLEENIGSFSCLNCPSFLDHFTLMCEVLYIEKQVDELKYQLSDESLQLLPEYRARIKVLKSLEYLTDRGIVKLKGRVAREIHTHELFVTELLVRNIFNDYTPQEVAALLSCLVFQQKMDEQPKSTASLNKGVKEIKEIAEEIGQKQRECGLEKSQYDFVDEFNFGMVDVVYHWASGKLFSEIMEMSITEDIQEGIIVRTIQRLCEVLKDLKKAADQVGEPNMKIKMSDACCLIKRDIVFAASLYTQ